MSNIGKQFSNIPRQVSFNLLQMENVKLELQVRMVDRPVNVVIFTATFYIFSLLLDDTESILVTIHVILRY